jgi:hypothetical protein
VTARPCGCPLPYPDATADPAALELLDAADRAAESLVAGSISRALNDARTARVFSAEQTPDP